MACKCSIVGLMNINYDGIISASINGSNNFIYVLQSCIPGQVDGVLKGPSTGGVNLSAYGYLPGENKYRGVECPSKAGVNIPLFSKFDCENQFTRFFPRRGGNAYRSGDPIDGITLVNEICSFDVMEASAQNGPFAPYFVETQYNGTALIWNGPPIPVDTTDTSNIFYDLQISDWTIQAYLNNFSIEVALPMGARVNYSFQYDIPACEVGDGVVIGPGDLTDFEFLACDSINMNYAPTGLVQVSFTVYSDMDHPTRSFTSMTIDNVLFEGYVTSLTITPIPGTNVFEHRYTLSGIVSGL